MNPQEQSHPPDSKINFFTITASRYQHSGRKDTWYVTCPEWQYKNETDERIEDHIGRIVKEIHHHNEALKLT